MLLPELRSAVVRYGKELLRARLTTGTGGNLSALAPGRDLLAISPSGLDYRTLAPEDVSVLDLEGRLLEGASPSSELAFHLAVHQARPDVFAVVHTHSVNATTLACLGWELPPVHYLVGFAGTKVPLAPYATFGTKELAENVVRSLGQHNAVLLANHGLVAGGPDLEWAFNTAEEVELVAEIYLKAKSVGEPIILPEDEMDRIVEKFKHYGARRSTCRS